MNIPLDEVVYFDGISSSSTGAAVDADSTPTFAVYEEATDADIGVGGNMTKRTSLTGNYRGSFTASAANGFEAGKWYNVIGSATVGAIVTKGVLMRFRLVAAEAVAGFPVVDATKWLGGTIPAVNVAGVPIVDNKYLLGTVYPTPTVDGVPNVNAKTINDVATTAITAINANVGTTQPVNFTGTGASALVKDDVTAISSDTTAADNFETMLDGTGGQVLSLKQLRAVGDNAGEGTIHAVNSSATGYGHYNLGQFGQYNHSIGGTAGQCNIGPIGQFNLGTAAGQHNFGIEGIGQDNEGLLDGQRNESISGIGQNNIGPTSDIVGDITGNLSGSVGSIATGGIVAASFAAGAIDNTAIAANAIGASELAADAVTEIQSGLATQTSVDDLPTNAELATALGTADDALLTQVALVKAKTDNLPSDPADASDIATSFGTVNSTLGTIAGYIDTEVGAIKAKTDLIPASPAAVGSAMTLTSGERDAIASAVFKLDLSTLTGEASRSLLNAIRKLRNKWSISGTTLTVYKEDDATPAYTQSLTATPGAAPITGIS